MVLKISNYLIDRLTEDHEFGYAPLPQYVDVAKDVHFELRPGHSYWHTIMWNQWIAIGNQFVRWLDARDSYMALWEAQEESEKNADEFELECLITLFPQ